MTDTVLKYSLTIFSTITFNYISVVMYVDPTYEPFVVDVSREK